jgi:bleomycin hydrolase
MTLTTLSKAPETTAAALALDDLVCFQNDFASKPAYRLMQNAVTETPIDAVALNRAIVTRADHTFSVHLDAWKVTHQKKSGRHEEDERGGFRVQSELCDVLG